MKTSTFNLLLNKPRKPDTRGDICSPMVYYFDMQYIISIPNKSLIMRALAHVSVAGCPALVT